MSLNTQHNPIQAVVFDLDGVITDTAHYHYLAWKALAEGEGVAFDEAFNEELKGVDRMGSLNRILARSSREYSDAEKERLAFAKNEHYKRLIADMSEKDLLPGAREALLQARELGLKVGLASVSKNAFTVLDSLKIRDLFDYVVDANTIKNGKPDPEIFLKAAENLGVAPEDCLGVEDSLAGLQSILSAGMRSLGIGEPEVLGQADKVISGLHQCDLRHYL